VTDVFNETPKGATIAYEVTGRGRPSGDAYGVLLSMAQAAASSGARCGSEPTRWAPP